MINFPTEEQIMDGLKINRHIDGNYIGWLKSQKIDLSNCTVQSYISDLNQFFDKYNAFTRKNILAFKEEMKETLSVVSMNRKMSSFKSYNRYLIEQGHMEDMIVHKSDQVGIQNIGNPTSVSVDDVLEFLETVKKKPSRLKVRNIAMIYLMANTGIRRHELCDLKISGLKRKNKGWILEVYGKENKQREVGLTPVAVKAVQNYLKERNNSKYANSPYLFLSQRGGRLTDSAINDMFEFYAEGSGIHPHALRHNCFSTWCEEGVLSPVEIQNQAGHKSLVTTQLYTHARQDAILKKIQSAGIGEL